MSDCDCTVEKVVDISGLNFIDSTTLRFGETEPYTRSGLRIVGKMYKLTIIREDGTGAADFIGDAHFWRDQFDHLKAFIDNRESTT